MRADCNHIGSIYREFLTDVRCEFAENRSRHNYVTEQIGGDVKLCEHLLVPVARVGVNHLRCGRNGVLNLLLPGEEIVEQIGYEKNLVRK